jgi:hypothetical protein
MAWALQGITSVRLSISFQIQRISLGGLLEQRLYVPSLKNDELSFDSGLFQRKTTIGSKITRIPATNIISEEDCVRDTTQDYNF